MLTSLLHARRAFNAGQPVRYASWWAARTQHRDHTPVADGSPAVPDGTGLNAANTGFFPLPEGSTEAASAILSASSAGDLALIAATKANAFFTSSYMIEAIQYMHTSHALPW